MRHPCPTAMLKTPLSLGGAYQEGIRALIRDLPNRWPNVSMLVPQDFMCDGDGCPTILNGEFLYRDQNHLRRNLTAETTKQLIHRLRLTETLSNAAIVP